MSMMKCWVFNTYGGADVLQIEERPIPIPGKDEVLIKVAASAINPSDVKNVSGFFNTSLPRVPGRDFSGKVIQGKGYEGREVWGSGAGFGLSIDGAHAEYIVMPSNAISLKPERLAMEHAAAIGVPYLAAWHGLLKSGALSQGQTILITGAAGAVGKAAIQIARWNGAQAIGAVRELPSDADDIPYISTLDEGWQHQVLSDTQGKGVDLVLDTVGGNVFNSCLETLRVGGRYVVLASRPAEVTLNMVDLYHNLQHIIGLDTMKLSNLEIKKSLDNLSVGFNEGHLTPPVINAWQFELAPLAYEAVNQGTTGVKQILTFPE
ncbi:quinone oxidoreductase family protein [Serratia marcescens]|uniref:quinone oxidoreductase family protein n=2 Tax=Serratia TaxID=613 RepID=UPI0039830D76